MISILLIELKKSKALFL